MSEQSGRKFPPSVSTTGASHATVPQHAKSAEIVAAHASIDNHFNQERALYSRDNLKLNRAAALAKWRQLCAK
jgi:hypothetical protein